MLAASNRATMGSCSADIRTRSMAPVCQPLPSTSAQTLLPPASLRNVTCNASQPKSPVKQVGTPIQTGPVRPGISKPTPPPTDEQLVIPSTADGKLISKTEIAAFIQRDDLMDQMYRWSLMEAGESGVRNFGLPMNVEPFYHNGTLWGFKVGIFKEGEKLTDLGIMFDKEEVNKHEWVGRGEDGFPVLEGKVDVVLGQHFEIWKLCTRPVDETLRSAIRLYCSGLVTALNRYYAFGSVFVDDAQ